MSNRHQVTCKVCDAPRWLHADRHRLCETHFLEYMRVNGRACYRRKMAKLGREVVAHRQWAAQVMLHPAASAQAARDRREP